MWLIPIVILVVLLVVIIGIYNKLVAQRQETMNAWSQIDVQLKRRYDLIPNLVETAKGFMTHEQETLTRVIEARNAAAGARGVSETAAANGALTSALGGFFALAESYPDLKSNTNMLALQQELANTEDKIGFARSYYNQSVTQYNTTIESFPSSLIAGPFGFKSRELYEIENAAERENVKVSFS